MSISGIKSESQSLPRRVGAWPRNSIVASGAHSLAIGEDATAVGMRDVINKREYVEMATNGICIDNRKY